MNRPDVRELEKIGGPLGRTLPGHYRHAAKKCSETEAARQDESMPCDGAELCCHFSYAKLTFVSLYATSYMRKIKTNSATPPARQGPFAARYPDVPPASLLSPIFLPAQTGQP